MPELRYASRGFNSRRGAEARRRAEFNGLVSAAWRLGATLCRSLQAAGFKVVVATITPRDASTGYSTANIATLASINSMIRAGYTAYADALADWAADPRLSDCTNTTYFSDGQNTTDAGDGVKATIVKSALDPLLGPPPTVELAFASFYSPGRSFAGKFGNFLRS